MEKGKAVWEKGQMPKRETVLRKAEEFGFDRAVSLDCGTLKPLAQVREMCSAGTCGQYGKNWSCPPACGSLAQCGEQAAAYGTGILVHDNDHGHQQSQQREYGDSALFANLHALTSYSCPVHPSSDPAQS